MMDDTYYFVLQKNVQENVTAAAELSEALSNVGITCEIVENTVLKIQVNADQFQNVTRRNAGKKKKMHTAGLPRQRNILEIHTGTDMMKTAS